jgi:type II secretory ATPase GspE/PulE/Tfp pilus assembly ATPase PilB-like protein
LHQSCTKIAQSAQKLPSAKKILQNHAKKRKSCTISKKIVKVGPKNFSKIKRSFYRGEGCDKCRQTGYRGRIGIHELLKITEGLKNTILKSSDSNTLCV